MSSWSEIDQELRVTRTPEDNKDYDAVRRKYLKGLFEHTGRNVVLYGSSWLHKTDARSVGLSGIDSRDLLAFKECADGLQGDELDLIVHSPGGMAESTEQVVEYLRSKFNSIRVIVPYMAMSAATLMACAANCIMMDRQSSLGPIDPQFLLPAGSGSVRWVAALDILDQFGLEKEFVDGLGAGACYPIFAQFGPDLITRSQNAVNLSEWLAVKWLSKHMFAGESCRVEKAVRAAGWLMGHRNPKRSHSRSLFVDTLEENELKVNRLESCPEMSKLVRSIFYAMDLFLAETDAVKVVENHQGQLVVTRPRV